MYIPEQFGPENELEQILFQTVQKKLYQKKSDGLRFQDAILPVFQEMLGFSDSIVQDLEENGQSAKVACKSGCSYCCHSQVNIIPIEALLISAFIESDFIGTQISDLKVGISRTGSLTAGKTFEQVYTIKGDLPCLFLKEGKCSIYNIRPTICRSWSSFDSKTCQAAYNSADSASSVCASPTRNFIFGTTRGVFAQISEAFTLQSETLLLQNAVADCLSISDPLGRWAQGFDVFKYE